MSQLLYRVESLGTQLHLYKVKFVSLNNYVVFLRRILTLTTPRHSDRNFLNFIKPLLDKRGALA